MSKESDNLDPKIDDGRQEVNESPEEELARLCQEQVQDAATDGHTPERILQKLRRAAATVKRC